MADYSAITDELLPPDISPDVVELIHDYVYDEDAELDPPGLPSWSPII